MKKLDLTQMEELNGGLKHPCEKTFFEWVALAITNEMLYGAIGLTTTIAMANACDELGY